MRAIGVSHTACKDEFRREIFDLTAGVYFNFLYSGVIYYHAMHATYGGRCSSEIFWGSLLEGLLRIYLTRAIHAVAPFHVYGLKVPHLLPPSPLPRRPHHRLLASRVQ